jgi:catechol 2,3-dioxygenase
VSQNGSIDPGTSMGPVRLTVADLDRARDFYRDAIGLTELPSANGVVVMGAGEEPVVELVGDPDAPPRPRGTSGLFHLAILVPSRPDLARALQRVAEAGWHLSGASDHLVSEALYLSDPEGNGIELYRDRPRGEWPKDDGNLQMATLPLDLEDLIREAGDGGEDTMPAGTRLGHVHLQVGDLKAAEDFYSGLLGFEVTVRSYPGALFVSAGGYHHHVGLNTWAGEGAPSPPPGSRGLRWFEVLVASDAELEQIATRAEAANVTMKREDGGLLLADPSGNGVVLRPPNQS